MTDFNGGLIELQTEGSTSGIASTAAATLAGPKRGIESGFQDIGKGVGQRLDRLVKFFGKGLSLDHGMATRDTKLCYWNQT